MIELRLPLRHIQVTQPFGVNYLDFYRKLGLLGHNGTDFTAKTSCPVYASHEGVATFSGSYSDGGIAVELTNFPQGIRTIYAHLEKTNCKHGDKIQAGQVIGFCDNTGKMTTGNHLHWGLKKVDSKGVTVDYDNGYKGALDPRSFVTASYNGIKIKTKDADKCNAYHRYYRPERNFALELKYVGILARIFKRIPKAEEINAAVYGSWDREALTNPAMYAIWGFIQKSDYLRGIHPFR